LASGFFLMGIALLYGFAGSVSPSDRASALPAVAGMDGLRLAGSVMLRIGLLFKVCAVPVQARTPDANQGAPTPITGSMAAATTLAAFAAMLRFVYVATSGIAWDLAPFLWGIAIITMLIGTVLAIVQTDIKRMLAYSSVAHAG